MRISHFLIDVDSTVRTKKQPSMTFERPRRNGIADDRAGLFSVATVAREGVYYVPTGVITPDNVTDAHMWSVTRQGTCYRVPLMEYVVPRAIAGVGLVILGLEQALLAARGVPYDLSKIDEIMLVLGTNVHEDDVNYHAYIGFAFAVFEPRKAD